jgi:cathepsin L
MKRSRRLSELPDSVNWVEQGAVTAPKNQGACGSCWTFAGVESIESALFLSTGKLVTLSEQEFVSCTPNPDQCGGSGGCQGATPDILFEYAMSKGFVLEDDYPYVSGNGTEPSCALKAKEPLGSIRGYTDVPENDYEGLLEAINITPVTISVDATSWHAYHSGVMDWSDCGPVINHAVLLVGYGTDEKTGLDYWLVRNSWGPTWGESGYIRLSRSTKCAVDPDPGAGTGCAGFNETVKVCGTCGVLYANSYPVGAYLY